MARKLKVNKPLNTLKRKCSDINIDFLLLYFYRFSHGSCAECRWLLLLHAVRVPSVVAWRRSPAADYQPAGGDEPRSCSPVPGPGSHQLLLHLRPQSDETPTLLGGIKPISCFYDWVLAELKPAINWPLYLQKGVQIYRNTCKLLSCAHYGFKTKN